MQPPARTGSFSSCTVKTVKGNVVVPLGLSDGQLDAAEGGASPYGLGSPLQADRLGARPLGRSSNGGDGLAPDLLSPDVSISQTKSDLADVSISYGKQQSRLAAQLAAKQLRRPSQLHESLRLDEQAEEAGPWGLLKTETETPTWWSHAKLRIQRLSQALLVRPGHPRMQWWFYVCVVMALISGWEVPFHFTFVEPGGLLAPYFDWLAIVEYMSTLVFFLDFLLKFSVMYIDTDSGVLVTSRRKIARRYVTSWQFYMDFVGWFPADWITIDTAAALGASDRVLTGLAWIKLLTLVRMYRVFEMFADLDYRMVLSQGTLMLTRNYTYVFFTTHWAACILYHVAAHQEFSPNSWVGRNAERIFGRPVYEKYLLSLYFSVSAFTGLGDAELFASSVPEQAFMIVYLLFNLFLGAYILGTVTMLVVKGDERSKAFRERMTNLNEFSVNNELPERLQTAMQEHLEVTFNTEQVDDEHVLGIYPTTIRRKVLRHLYLHPVRNCYLFKGCKQRFLDALLTVARVELFMPAVQLLIEGDNVTELNIIVSGEVLVAEAGINLSAAFSQFATNDPSTRASRNWRSSDGGGGGDPNASMAQMKRTPSMSRTASMSRMNSVGRNSSMGRTSSCNGSIKDFLIDGTNGFMEMTTGKKVMTRYSGDALAEVPFFTDVPSNETIMSQSVVRVLSIPKAAWEELMDQFPQQARLVLTNLQHRAEDALSQELQSAVEVSQLTEEQLRTSLQHGKTKRGKNMFKKDAEPPVDLTEILPQPTIDFLNRLDDVRAIVRAHVRKVDQLRTFEFLGCASEGDIEALRTMLNQGMNPNSADYDGRTGLMLAASGGHEGVVRLLLDSGAKSDQLDAFGNSAMCEAVKNAHDEVIDVLLSYGATLAMDAMAVASVMCTAVFEGDLVKLRRLLRSGAPPDSCDYDKRSALHIAGAEGNLAAVKLLVEEGGADPNFQDRWGNTALDEARRVGATPVVSYLESLMGSEQMVGSGVRYRQKVATDFLAACGTGDLSRARYIAHNSRPGCIFTGLVLAATKGHKDVAELLLAWVQPDLLRNEGHLALVAAARMGHSAVVAALRSNGIQLPDPRDPILLAHMRAAVLSVDVRAVAALLAASVDVRAAEGSALLHSAAATGSLEMVRRLVEEGGMRPNAEDSAGKTPAAVAEAAKLTAIADYLRWATSAAGASAAAAGGAASVAAAAAAAVQSLCAAATTKYGQLSDYASLDSHDHISHGITAPGGLLESDEDDGEPPPPVLARMASFSSVGSSRRMTALGTVSRQPSMPRGNALWKLSSMARMAANSQTGELTDSGQGGDAPAAAAPRRQRRASLTQFLSGHRVDGITENTTPGLNEADLAAFLANADPEALSGPYIGGSRAHSNHTGGRKGSSTGFATSAASVSSAVGARRRSSATGMSGGLSAELAGLPGPNHEAATAALRAASKTGSFTMHGRGGAGAGVGGASPVGRPPSRHVGAPLLPPPGPQGSLPRMASTSMAQTEQSFSRAGSFTVPASGPPSGLRRGPQAAGSPRPLSPPTPPEGSKEGAGNGRSQRLEGNGDALESFLQVAPSAYSASLSAAPPGDGGGGGGGGGGRSGASSGTRARTGDDLSHRTLEKQLTALSPPER